MEKKCSRRKKIQTLISGTEGVGVGTSIRNSRAGTKFRLKMTLLKFWIKLTQKRYFRTKNLNITIKCYIFKLIQTLKFSFNKQFGFLERISKKKFCTKFSKKRSYFQSKTDKIDTTIEFCIFELVFVSNLILKKQF